MLQISCNADSGRLRYTSRLTTDKNGNARRKRQVGDDTRLKGGAGRIAQRSASAPRILAMTQAEREMPDRLGPGIERVCEEKSVERIWIVRKCSVRMHG